MQIEPDDGSIEEIEPFVGAITLDDCVEVEKTEGEDESAAAINNPN